MLSGAGTPRARRPGGEQLQRFLDLLIFGHLYRTLATHINYRHITGILSFRISFKLFALLR